MPLDRYLNSIINGDAKSVLSKMPTGCVDLVVTSPPYDNLREYDNCTWDFHIFQGIAKQLYRVVKDGGVVVWVVGDAVINGAKTLTSYKQALFFQKIGFQMYDVIIYEKAGSGPPHNNRYFNSFEYMFVLSKGRPKTINILKDKPNKWSGMSTFSDVTRREADGSLVNKGKKTINQYGVRTNIWRYANGRGFATKDEIAYQHPAIFPEKLVEDHIKSWSNEGDLILDPFGGSGTVAKVARQMKRDWVLIEVSETYCDLARTRLNLADNV